MAARPLTDYSDEELVAELRRAAEHVTFYVNDILAEMDRREARRRERIIVGTAVLAAGASVVSAVIALVAVAR